MTTLTQHALESLNFTTGSMVDTGGGCVAWRVNADGSALDNDYEGAFYLITYEGCNDFCVGLIKPIMADHDHD